MHNKTNLETARPKVVILNPYIPSYRLALFQLLRDKLNSRGVGFEVVTGTPSRSARLRLDNQTADYHRETKSIRIPFFGAKLRYVFASAYLREAEAVVYEYSISNLNTWKAVLLTQNHRVILWGHGPGYLAKAFRLRKKLEKFMAQRADSVLVYTEYGRDRMISQGSQPEKVVALQNTFDWQNLRIQVSALGPQDILDFRRQFQIPNRNVYAYLGALDSAKRIRFISQVLDHVWRLDQSAKFIIAGEGRDKRFLRKAASRGQAILMGRVDDRGKALVAEVSTGFVNPGNIGLLAIDALVLGKPVFGTSFPSSPEKDYLVEGVSLHTFPDNPRDFATRLLEFNVSGVFESGSFPNPPTIGDYSKRFVEVLLNEPNQTRLSKRR